MSVVRLKQKYNENLRRYYNGVNYLDEHIEECDKYLPILLKLLDNINIILERIMQLETVTDKEILEGFAI